MAPPPEGTPDGTAAPDRKWWVVVAMSGVMIALTLDFFGLAVALPEIGKDLDASTETLLWAMNAYLLAFVAIMIPIGRLADIVGRRKIVLGGIVCFVVGSALCGVAETDIWLIAARVLQGIGGGTIFATSVSVVNNAFPPEERPQALGIWSGVGLLGSALGPFVAGILTEYASWRVFFFLNIPIGIATMLITLAAVEESRDETFTGGIDWWGFLTLVLGFPPLIFGIQQGAQSGWGSPEVIAAIAVGVFFIAAFVVIELRTTKRAPLVEFSLFRDVRFAGASAVAFLGNWQFGTILFFLTLYLQNVLGLSPNEAGLIFLVFSIPLVVMSPIGGRLVARYGAQRLMSLGMALVAVGVACFAALDTDSGLLLVVVGLLFAGLGQGFAYNLSNTAGMESMPDEKTGVASGVLQTARLMGIVIGLAISGAVFRALENDEIVSKFRAKGTSIGNADEETVRGLLSGSQAARHQLRELSSSARTVVDQIVDAAFVKGQRGVMLLGLVVCLLGVWAALWGRTKARSEGRVHRVGHGFTLAHWRPSRAGQAPDPAPSG
jgi:EmrB/QacA subfamily drug resistance transporter